MRVRPIRYIMSFCLDIWKYEAYHRAHHPGETYLFYVLKPGAFIGLAMYSLNITFNEDGSYDSAGIVYSD